MKKLITLAVALGAVALTHAASFDWKVSGTSATVNYQVYIVGSIVSTWTSVSDLATAASKFGENTFGTIKENGRSTYANGSVLADSISKDSASVCFVIVSSSDATSYSYVEYDVASYVYSGVETPSETFTIAAADLLNGTKGSFAGSIPEPTSGLLMLVGLAGLALRRKRA